VVVEGAHEHGALAIADRQRGRVNRRQLVAAHWTPGLIRTATGHGWLRRVDRSVYVVGADVPTPLTRETEVLLEAGLGMALSGMSVLAALALMPRREGAPIHLTAMSGRRRNSRPGITFHAFSDLTPADFRVIDGLPMTTVERALLDAATTGSLEPRQIERALDEAVPRHLTSRTKVRELLLRTHQRPGHALLNRLADQRRPSSRTDSALAERALEIIRAANLPAPSTEEDLFGYRADNYWAEAGVVLEVDSFKYHGLIRANFDRDRRKDRIYSQHDILVVRWSDNDIATRPMELAAHLGMTIARRMAERVRETSPSEARSPTSPSARGPNPQPPLPKPARTQAP
jgi:very-short-patch-repair endonuclease